MIESTPWLAKEGRRALGHYIKRKPSARYPGLLRQHINLARTSEDTQLFKEIATAIGNWVVSKNIDVIAVVTREANRCVDGARRRRPELPPTISYRKRGDSIEIVDTFGNAEAIIEGRGKVGIVTHETTTRLALLEFSRTAPLISDLPNKHGLVIVDRGRDLEGVQTPQEVEAYIQDRPTAVSPHVELPFLCDMVMRYELSVYRAMP
jgi:hypothetical protein